MGPLELGALVAWIPFRDRGNAMGTSFPLPGTSQGQGPRMWGFWVAVYHAAKGGKRETKKERERKR